MAQARPGSTVAGRYRLDAPRPGDLPGGERWTATDQILARPVTVTLVSGPRAGAVLDAARRAALVVDPRLTRILDVGTADGTGYVVTAAVEGRSLGSLAARAPLAADQARAVVGEAAAALEAARRRGVHHLALRPDVVLLTPAGRVVLEGLAVDGELLGAAGGSAHAMSRADTVGLVRVLYAALTGRWPAAGTSAAPAVPSFADWSAGGRATADAPAIDTGLAAAPEHDGAPLPPVDLVAGVPADLDTLCAVTLGPHDDGPHSPGELVRELEPWRAVRADEIFRAADAGRWPALPDQTADTTAPEGAGTTTAPPTGSSPMSDDQNGTPDGDAATPASGSAAARGAAAGVAGAAAVGAAAAAATPVARQSVRSAFTGPQGPGTRRPGTPPPAVPSGSAPGSFPPAAPTPARPTTRPTPVAEPTPAAEPASTAAAATVPPARSASPAEPAAALPPAIPPSTEPAPPTIPPASTRDADARAAEAPGRATSGDAPAPAPTEPDAVEPDAGEPDAADLAVAGITGAGAGTATAPEPVEEPAPAVAAPARRTTSAFSGRSTVAAGAAATPEADAASTRVEPRETEPGRPAPEPAAPVPAASGDGGGGDGPGRPEWDLPFPAEQPASSVAQRRFDPTRWVLGAVAVAVVVGVVIAVGNVLSPFRSSDEDAQSAPVATATAPPVEEPAEGEAPAGGEQAPATAPPVIAGITSIDPSDGDGEHEELVGRLNDGDPATTWYTHTYNRPDYAGFKDAVGLVITLQAPATVTSVTIDGLGTGGNVELRATDAANPTAGDVLAGGALATPQTVLTLAQPTETQSIVLWFTSLSQTSDGANKIELSNIAVS